MKKACECFSMCYYFFVEVGFEKTLITPAASGAPRYAAVITQQGAHLRQPCLLSEPRDRAGCLGEHRKASPVMLGPPLHSLGSNKRVTWFTLHPQPLPLCGSLSSAPAFALVRTGGTVPWCRDVRCPSCHVEKSHKQAWIYCIVICELKHIWNFLPSEIFFKVLLNKVRAVN